MTWIATLQLYTATRFLKVLHVYYASGALATIAAIYIAIYRWRRA
jgi:hypothetical protein